MGMVTAWSISIVTIVSVHRRDQLLLEKTELVGIKSELKVNNLCSLKMLLILLLQRMDEEILELMGTLKVINSDHSSLHTYITMFVKYPVC